MTRIKLQDTLVLDGVRRTEDGYLTAFARVARTGIQEYKGSELGRPDLSTVRVYRPESEVFAPDAMQSFAHRPITLTHPKVPVNAKNWSKYAKGQTGDEIVRDGQFVRVPMVMMDQGIIDAYEKGGVKELSMGYSTDLKWEQGKTPDGMTYDAIQTNIRGNHLAVVPRARGGDQLRIGDRDFTAAERDDDADSGAAMPDGSFPIKTVKDLKNAIQSIGRAKDEAAAKRHIIKRAKALGAESELPSTWTTDANTRVALDAAGDPNHGKVGIVIGKDPTDPSRARVRFGDEIVPYPTKYLHVVDDDDDEDDDLVACPECGAEIPADSDDCPECGYDLMKDSANNEGVITMKQIMIDGVPVDVVNDQGGAIIERHVTKLETRVKDAETASGKATAELADAKKTIEAKDGEIAVLKKQVEDAKVTPEKLDIMVKDRLAVVDRASKVLDKTFSYDGKSVEDIRRAAVSAKLGDAATKEMSDAAVQGAFTALTADGAGGQGGTRQLRDGLSGHAARPITNSVDARDAAYAEMEKNLTNNWRTTKVAS